MIIDNLLDGSMKLGLPDEPIYKKICDNWDKVAKPLDSLGDFEKIIAGIGAATLRTNPDISKKAIVMMIADNGIVARGVSQCGQEVTAAVAKAMGKKLSSVGKMAAVNGVDTFPIDIGINSDEEIQGVRNCKIKPGTNDFLEGAAMSHEDTLEAVETGIRMVGELADKGYGLIGMGEMGIGNTTTSATLAAVLFDAPAGEVTGRGAGLSGDGLSRKVSVVAKAKELYGKYKDDPLKVLSCVGGFDIAGLVGIAIGGAYYKVPIVLDGVISAIAALVAVRMFPAVRQYLIASHLSREPVAAMVFDELGLKPVIDANMALGEGTGAVMMMSLIDHAMALYEDKTTFDDMEIEAYVRHV